MSKKRVDIELELDVLAWYASEATKASMSRRQFMTRVLEKVQDIMEQSPNLSLVHVVSSAKSK